MLWTVVLKKTLVSPLDCKEIQPVHPKGDQSWVFIGRTDVEAKTPKLWPHNMNCVNFNYWKRPWCWKRLRAGGEGDDRGWEGWMASPTQWTWVWVDSGSWWCTGRPGVLWFMESHRIGRDWVTELNWAELLFMIWATVSSQSCFCWLYKTSTSLAAKNIINLILVLTIWWCPCVESSLVLLEEGVCYDQCILLAKLLLAFALLHFVCQGQICLLLQLSLYFLLLHSSPVWWKGHLFWLLVLEGLVGLHRTAQL